MSGGKEVGDGMSSPVERAAQLPHRRGFIRCLGQLPRKTDRKFALTTEIKGPELDEDCITVFPIRRSILDRKVGKLPERLYRCPYLSGRKRTRAHADFVEHRGQNRLGRADQHLVMIPPHNDLVCRRQRRARWPSGSRLGAAGRSQLR